MQKSDYPFPADWFAISLRWLVLLGITNSLVVARSFNAYVAGAILFSAVWNIFISLLAIMNRRLWLHRELNLVADMLVSGCLFFWGGGLTGPLVWSGLLGIFSASIYYGWRGSLVAAAVLCVVQIGGEFLGKRMFAGLEFWYMLCGFNLLAGGVFGVLSQLLMRGVKQNYQSQLGQRYEADRHLKKSERGRMHAFYQMIETLSATLDYQVVLETALDLSLNVISGGDSNTADLVCAVLLFGEEHNLNVATARRFPPTDMRLTFPAESGVLKEIIQTAEPRLLTNPYDDPELASIIALKNCKSAICLPLNRGLNAYGVMLFAHSKENYFNPERAELLEMISHQAVVAIQNARLYKDLELEKERILEQQEEARKKLARDLHDGPTQSVSAIAMRMAIARKYLERDKDEAMEEMVKIEELARRTTQEIRTMLFTLRPLVLESEGLIAALQAMSEKMRDTYQQNVLIDVDPEVVRNLEVAKQTVVFYISEEAVNNARKHAQAQEIRVRLKFAFKDKSVALLEIADNGKGFDPEAIQSQYERRGSLGMINLRERTDLINGILRINSEPGKGTRIQVAIPLNEKAADLLQRRLAGTE